MKISLIISTYNRPDMLELVLKCVAEQVLMSKNLDQSKVEVLVADDGSRSDTANLIARHVPDFPFRLIHVWHQDNGFRAGAIRNLAVSKSSGDYLISIDGDCLLPTDFLQNQFLLAEPGYFVAGNRVLLSKKYTQQILQTNDISITKAKIAKSFIFRLMNKTNKWFPSLRFDNQAQWRKSKPNDWRRPKGCNVAIWRKDYEAVNGFDESFIGWGHEDADLFVRLLHLGIKIKDGRFAAPVYHLWHKINDRGNERKNMHMLLERVNDINFIQALDGFDKYRQ